MRTYRLESCPLDGKPLLAARQDLSDLRGLQDWCLRYELTAVEGVSEVASLGGFVKQYQVVVDPVKLLAYGLPLQKVKAAIQRSNLDAGGRLIEMSETEYLVRGLGYLGSLIDREMAAARVGQGQGGAGDDARALPDQRALSARTARPPRAGRAEPGGPRRDRAPPRPGGPRREEGRSSAARSLALRRSYSAETSWKSTVDR